MLFTIAEQNFRRIALNEAHVIDFKNCILSDFNTLSHTQNILAISDNCVIDLFELWFSVTIMEFGEGQISIITPSLLRSKTQYINLDVVT